ncbi:MAG: hypothetical protein P9E24_00985 [Candidatus Competibacter sp.]|nr:hypothetical protein [Candidatus Competibacter sp.]MDG4584626.1 hypothetical protein [Candidatus Competibacter sp.]
MKTILMNSAVVLSMVSLAVSAEETSTSFSWGNVTFQPRAYAGYANYSLDSDIFTFIRDSDHAMAQGPLNFDALETLHKIDINGFLWGLGGTVASGRFFGDIYYQSTLNETVQSGTGLNLEEYTFNIGGVKAQHSDWAVSLGYMITDQWSVFAGYKSGSTESDQSYQGYTNSPNRQLIENGSLDTKFDQDGPFLGTSYSFPIGSGALTIKAAYAYLNGDFEWNNQVLDYPPLNPLIITQQYKLDGNSNAFSLGISWTQSLMDNLGYSLGANYHRYDFDMSGTSTGSVQNVPDPSYAGTITNGSLTEELFTITASIFYRF